MDFGAFGFIAGALLVSSGGPLRLQTAFFGALCGSEALAAFTASVATGDLIATREDDEESGARRSRGWQREAADRTRRSFVGFHMSRLCHG